MTALLIQNTNPAMVCPELELVHEGFAREDLFTCVHEQFMTETAAFADIVLPATMFLEHDDFYTASGHTFFQVTKAVIEPPGECRENHYVISELAKRLGAKHRGFDMTPWEIMDETLRELRHVGRRDQLDEAAARTSISASRPRTSSTASPGPTRSSASSPTGRRYGPRGKEMPSAARPFRRDRQCHGRQAVPPGRGAGAHLPQLDLHRDAELARSARCGRRC